MMRQRLPSWTAGTGNIPGLDGLRALSILIVMASHLITERIPGGLGVYVFFVISGFLIAHLMFAEAEKTGHVSLRKFYLRRAVRLYPALIAFVAVTTLYALAVRFPISGTDIASSLLYFANYHRSRPFGIIWSLSVEEHFYFLFPSVMVLARANAKLIFATAIAVCIGCLSLRLIVGFLHPELAAAGEFYNRTEYRLDSIAYGVLVAAAIRMASRSVGARAVLQRIAHPGCSLAALVVVLACLVTRDLHFRETVRYSLLGASIAVVLVGVLLRPSAPARLLNIAPLVWIGKLSYSLYLWHYFVKFSFQQAFPSASVLQNAPLLVGASFCLAAASYYGLERPMQSLRSRLNAAKGPPADPRLPRTAETPAPSRLVSDAQAG